VSVAQHGGRRGASFVVDSVTLSESPAVATVSADAPASAPAFGVHVHALWGTYTNEQRIAVLDRLAAAGARWLRIDISWCSFQGASMDDVNDYWVDLLDFVVDAARARGLNVLGNTICTPAWATDCPSCNWEMASPRVPRSPAMFGHFMELLAGHFRGRIAAWELWNEPNESNHQFWQGDARQYVDLVLRPGFEAVKRLDPAATVVAAGTSYVDRAWIASVYDAGGGAFFDALAVHPYMAPWNLPPETDNGTRWTITHIDSARQAMVDHGDAHKPIWFTEFGWSSSFPTYAQGVSEAQQAEYAVRALELVRTRFPYVRNVFWYNDRDRGSGHAREDAFGILHRDLSPKPVYDSLKSYLTGA
jgi:hypothetical protein